MPERKKIEGKTGLFHEHGNYELSPLVSENRKLDTVGAAFAVQIQKKSGEKTILYKHIKLRGNGRRKRKLCSEIHVFNL